MGTIKDAININMSNTLKKEMHILLWAFIEKELNDFPLLYKSTLIISKP